MGPVGSNVNRPYDSGRRRARSAETRQRIIDAARELVLDVGYRATTVAAIAAKAEVNVDTVYQLVGRKPVLLRELKASLNPLPPNLCALALADRAETIVRLISDASSVGNDSEHSAEGMLAQVRADRFVKDHLLRFARSAEV